MILTPHHFAEKTETTKKKNTQSVPLPSRRARQLSRQLRTKRPGFRPQNFLELSVGDLLRSEGADGGATRRWCRRAARAEGGFRKESAREGRRGEGGGDEGHRWTDWEREGDGEG